MPGDGDKGNEVEQEEEKMRGFASKHEHQTRACMKRWENSENYKLSRRAAARAGRGVVTHSAARRLMRELAIVKADPSWGVSADIVDDNLLCWHCNVAAPGGVTGKGVLHLELSFPPTYPAYPPTVTILGSDVKHPNVFPYAGKKYYICVDMLQEGDVDKVMLTPFTGWSSAYGVQAILRQLQSFFYTGEDRSYSRLATFRPMAEQSITSFALPNHIKHLALHSGVLFTVENNGMRLFDTSRPDQDPKEISYFSFQSGEVTGVYCKSANEVYIDIGRTIKIVSCLNPLAPEEIGNIKIKTKKSGVSPENTICFYKEFLYAFSPTGLRIYDISDPSAPNQVGIVSSLHNHWEKNKIIISPQQGLFYIIMQDSIGVYDLEDPTSPVLLPDECQMYNPYDSSVHYNDIAFMPYQGVARLYVATSRGILIYDVTNIRDVAVGSVLLTPVSDDFKTVAVHRIDVRGAWVYCMLYNCSAIFTIPAADPAKVCDVLWDRATRQHPIQMYSMMPTNMTVDMVSGSTYIGFADPSPKLEIVIKQWSSEPFWEVMLHHRCVSTWRDWKWDPFSRCKHTPSGAGWCTSSHCDGYGRYNPKWTSMHLADCAKLEQYYNAYKEDGCLTDDETVTIKRQAFAKKYLTSRKKLCTVLVSSAVRIDLLKGYEHIAYRHTKEQKCKPFVQVETTWGIETTKISHMNVAEGDSEVTVHWDQWLDIDLGVGKNAVTTVKFVLMVEIEDAKTITLGTGSLRAEEIGDKPTNFTVRLKGHEPGLLHVTACTPSVDLLPYVDVCFKEVCHNGRDSYMTLQSSYDKRTWYIRRRVGYECDSCGHSAGVNTFPELPSVLECDDAPTYALNNFHKELLEAAEGDKDALEGVKRVMISLKDEKMAAGSKPSPLITDAPEDIILRIMEWLPRNRERRYMAQVCKKWEPLYQNAQFWEAQHLKCFTTKAAWDEDVLGIGVNSAKAANDRPVFSCQFDPISFTAYTEGVRLGVWKEKFTHWIPLYINHLHAQRSMIHMDTMFAELSKDIRTSVAKVQWMIGGGDLEGQGKKFLRKIDVPGDVFKSTAWVGIKGGEMYASECHYYQVQVLDYAEIEGFKVGGNKAAHGAVKIGWVTNDGDVNLGVDKCGFCYSTVGHKVHNAGREPYGPPIKPGDVVGTLWNATDRTISYYLNGEDLGVAFVVPKYKGTNALAPGIAFNKATIAVDIEGGFDPPVPVVSSTLCAQSALSDQVSGILIALPQIMNNLVVEVMKGQLHASVKALQGYCAVHRLMLYCCDTYDELQFHVERSIARFIDHTQERHKSITPDLGTLLCLLSVSTEYTWTDLKSAFLQELFSRHVRWSLKKSKLFAARAVVPDAPGHDFDLMKQSFRANLTSCKLVMFQIFFCKLVRPDGGSYDAMKTSYDTRMGFPTSDMTDALIKEIGSVEEALKDEWPGFLANIGARPVAFNEMAKRLRDAISRSDACGYHDDVPLPSVEEAEEILENPQSFRKGKGKGKGKGNGKGRGKGKGGKGGKFGK